MPTPAAYRPHSAWLRAVASPSLGWFVASGDDIVAEDVGGEALQRLLRPDLDEDAGALVVQRAQAVDELHRRRHLGGQQVEHLGHHVGAHRVELAGDVGDDRDLRRPQLEALSVRRSGSLAGATIEVWKAWLTGSMAVCEAALLAALDGGLDGDGRPADDGL